MKRNNKPTRGYWIAFGLPVLAMMMVQLIAGSAPFGSKLSMLYSDMYHQYYPFFVEFRRALRSGDSLLYTWSVGMGMDYLAMISYYLASPLNLLTVLLPESWMLGYFSLIMPIKLGLAGLFFAIFLHRMYDGRDDLIGLFGAFYGLCAWALGYQWNIMWLDTFALLPLMALGTVQLLRDRKFGLYTVTLFLSIFANYYVGFFTCIFTLLLFICYESCRWKGGRRFWQDFVRIGIFTVLAIGMTAVLELPALAGLQNTQSSVNAFPTGFRMNIADENTILGLFDAMRQVAGNTLGGLTPTFKEGLPNLYCGVGTVLLGFLFLTCREIRLRDKIAAACMLLFFTLSFILRQLDYIWHGMHFTNMIPYRFSFLFSFVLLCMAYQAWQQRSCFQRWNLTLAGALTMVVIALSDGWRGLLQDIGDTDSWLFLAFNLGFLVLYLLALSTPEPQPAPKAPAGKKKHKTPAADIPAPGNAEQILEEGHPEPWQRIAAELKRDSDGHKPVQTESVPPALSARARKSMALALMFVMVLEIGLNMLNFGLRFSFTTVTNYPKGTSDTAAVIDYMKEREQDNPFYRAEVTHSQTLNDGALNDYHGISTFSSSANVRVTRFMQALGYGAKNTYNRYCFEESSPVANLFLNLRYMIERDGQLKPNDYFDAVYSSGSVTLLENNAYLPLGFLTNRALGTLEFDRGSNAFLFQNQLFRAAVGSQGDVWHLIADPEITAEKVTLESTGGTQCSYKDAQSGGTVTYRFTVREAGFLCLDLDASKRNSYEVLCNGSRLFSESLSLPQMISACNVQPGDEITVRLTCKQGEKGRMDIKAAVLDGAEFRSGVERLQENPLMLTHFSNTRIEGRIICNRDGLLYTSVPYDGNWVLFVDGEETEPVLVGDAMIAAPLYAGAHEIRLEYHNAAFSLGWKVSLGCAAVFAVCLLAAPRKKNGKYQK